VSLASLIQGMKEEIKAENDSLINLDPTGIDIYDIYSGGGLPRGGFLEFVGNPGAGKTTLALQILGRKIKDSESSDKEPIIIIFDAERSMTNARLASFGLNPQNLILVQRGITIEKIFAKISQIFEYKDKKGIKDHPTYILWDSIAHTPAEKELEVDDINSAIGVKAKVLGSLIRKYDEDFLDYNTTMIAINQLSSKVSMGANMYAKTVAIKGLGDRSVPGGTAQYYAAFHFVLLERQSELTGSEFGFKGYILKGSFLKNKAAQPFEDFLMVMDYKNGVNEFWTKFLYLKEAKILKVNGGWYTLEGYTDDSGKLKKFRGAQTLAKYEKEEDFRKIFDEYWGRLRNKMIETLTTVATPEEEETSEAES